MKKFLSLLLAVMLLLGCLPAMAEDAEWKIDQYTGLVSRLSAAEKLDSIVVPAEVDGIAVRGIEYMAFNMHKNFKQLTIADSAVMLDRRVLRDLLKLETVDLPENLLIIREGNFTNLPKLTSVVIPANVALVHSSFNKCASLTSITFEGMCPVFVTAGTFGMFTDLPADCVIYVPDNQVSAYKAALADREDVVARIQPSGRNAERIDRPATESGFAFDASTGTITRYTGTADYLVIPTTIDGVQVKHIADFAFETNVCCIIIPEGVETIGRYSLGHELLTYVSLPSTLTNVGDGAFSSSYLSAISYPAADVPAYEAAAFEGVKGDAWQLILPYGTSQEQVDAFAAYMAPSAPKAVVRASIIEPYSFPELDVEAGAPYIGSWTAVAVTDGADFYGMDLLGISMTAVLNDDGTGVVDIDGDAAPGGWYVEDGAAIFAPILEEGGQPVPEEAMPFTLDENARMCLDLGGMILLMEKEGAEYAVPAIPEKPWPELDADKAQYYVGTWDAVSYIVDGETYPAELVGPTTLILNADGTAQMMEGEEEAYELRWYADSYSAYVGPAMSALVEIYFDTNGNLQMMQDGSKIVFAPHVEPTPVPTAAPTPEPVVNPTEGGEQLLGDWYDDLGNKLTLRADGSMDYTYASDGWVNKDSWAVVDGAAVVTGGTWEGADIYLRDGIVFIDNDEGIFQIFSRDGDLSAYYGEDDDDYDMPEAQPIGDEGAAYFGAWKGDMFGMEVILTLNPDGTCAMEMMGEAEPGVWTMENGTAFVMGDEILLDGNQLTMPSVGMVFTKAAGSDPAGNAAAQPDQGGDPYIGVRFNLVGASINGINITAEQLNAAGDYVIFNADGSVELCMSDRMVQTLGWTRGKVTVMGAEHDGFCVDYYGTYYNFGITGDGLILDYFGTPRFYEAEKTEPAAEIPAETPSAAAPDAAADAAPVFATYADYMDIKFVASTYTSFGTTMDASTLGAEYAVTFHANGACEFIMGGVTAPGVTWALQEVAMGLTTVEAFVINYYGVSFNCIPTDTGFDMDFYGTMNLHYVPAR